MKVPGRKISVMAAIVFMDELSRNAAFATLLDSSANSLVTCASRCAMRLYIL